MTNDLLALDVSVTQLREISTELCCRIAAAPDGYVPARRIAMIIDLNLASPIPLAQ
jgi:hypothetical protein